MNISITNCFYIFLLIVLWFNNYSAGCLGMTRLLCIVYKQHCCTMRFLGNSCLRNSWSGPFFLEIHQTPFSSAELVSKGGETLFLAHPHQRHPPSLQHYQLSGEKDAVLKPRNAQSHTAALLMFSRNESALSITFPRSAKFW